MTERWRKKLEGIDGASPSDDVFERAKEGPMHSDDPLPGPRMSTRVITIVAAFLVFALAISVFAIPALRIGNTGRRPGLCAAAVVAGADLRSAASSCRRNPPTWALDPKQVAEHFAQEVMGWSGAFVGERWRAIFRRTLPARRAIPPRPIAGGTFSRGLCVDRPLAPCWRSGSSSVSRTNSAGPSQTGRSGATSVFPCGPTAPTGRLPHESVQVYQPLEQGDGQIWAVLQAQGQETLSVAPGQVVHDGSSVSAGFVMDRGLVPTLGYGSCGQSEASSAYHSPGGSGGAGIQSDVHLTGGCEGEQPGYVWAATSNVSLADTGDGIVDPFAGGRPALASITAAPVTMIFPASTGETTASTSPTPVKSVSPNGRAVAVDDVRRRPRVHDGAAGRLGNDQPRRRDRRQCAGGGSLHPDQSRERPATGRFDVPVELRRLRKRQPAPLLRRRADLHHPVADRHRQTL